MKSNVCIPAAIRGGCCVVGVSCSLTPSLYQIKVVKEIRIMTEMQFNVRALKGAPLSIVIVLMLQQGRSVSHSFLCRETGYSDRTVTAALEYLKDAQIVTRTGHSGFMLTGNNYQLPLMWDERTEPANPSPAFDAPAEFLPERPAEKFSGNNSEVVNSTILKRVETLEDEILRLRQMISEVVNSTTSSVPSVDNSNENNTEVVKNTAEVVNSPTLINESNITDTDFNNEDSLIDCESELWKIAEFYQRSNSCSTHGHGLYYTDEEIQQIINLHPDPDVFEYILPRAGSFETAMKWAKYDKRHAKYHMLKRFGVTMPALQQITDNENITLWEVDYQYWKWFKYDRLDHPNYTLGLVVRKIENGYDRNNAINSDPLEYRWL